MTHHPQRITHITLDLIERPHRQRIVELQHWHGNELDTMVPAAARRGGGTGNPIIVPFGLMLLALGFLSVIFHRLRQSNIVACILNGLLVGTTSAFKDLISLELANAFIELGIILVLFMGGLEVDLPAFKARWRLVLANGLGQIIV